MINIQILDSFFNGFPQSQWHFREKKISLNLSRFEFRECPLKCDFKFE